MGAEPYWYFTKYDSNVDRALQGLREQEFEAGRYFPAMWNLAFPIDPTKPSPGAQHASIDEAREAAGAEGTRSILDVEGVSEQPAVGFAAPLADATLEDLYGTRQPTRNMVDSNSPLCESIERGQAIYMTVYQNGHPDELMFAGFSYD
jgi:hypothetical protein